VRAYSDAGRPWVIWPAANRRANRKYFLLSFIILIEIRGPNERSHTRSRRSESVCGWHCRHERRRELRYVRDLIARAGIAVVLVDVGPRSREADCDIRSEEVAVYHPEGSLAVRTDDRGRAIEAMAEAFSRFLARQPDVAGVIGLGGSGGSAIIAPALQALPIGVPKILVSTFASGDVSAYVGTSDIQMINPGD
jgi:hypothetical protein